MFVLVDVLTGEVVRVKLHQGQPEGGLLLVIAKFKVQSGKRFCTWVITAHIYSLSLIARIILNAMIVHVQNNIILVTFEIIVTICALNIICIRHN